MLLSRHVTLEQLLATSHKLDNSIVDTLRYGKLVTAATIQSNLAIVAALLDPFIDKFGSGQISSGYRCPALNLAVGGSMSSAHKVGLAIDWQTKSISAAVKYALDSMMQFDRLIVECRGPVKWLHVQAASAGESPALAIYYSPLAGIYQLATPERIAALGI